MDPRWGRVIYQTLPSLVFLILPIQEGSGRVRVRVWPARLPIIYVRTHISPASACSAMPHKLVMLATLPSV